MAEGGEPKSLSSMVKCDICFELMTEPRILNCLHHFCLPCIKKMLERNQQGPRGVNCPTCRKFTPEENIQSSFIMNNLLEIHNALKYTKHNDDDTEIGTHHGKACTKHPGLDIEYNCKNCNKAGCAKCMVDDHNGHATESIDEGLACMLVGTRKHMEAVMKHNEELQERLLQLERKSLEYTSNFDYTKKAIQDHAEVIVMKIKKDVAHLVEAVDTKAKATFKELDVTKRDLESQLSSQESLILWTNTVINMTKGPATLCELQEGLYQRVENCVKETVLKDSDRDMYLANFTPNKPGGHYNLIGEVKFTKSHSYSDVASIPSHDVRTKDNRKPIQSYLAGRKSRAVSFRKINKNLHRLNENTFKKARKWSLGLCNFKLVKKSYRFAYINNTLWCPCCETTGNIHVYNTDGHLLHTICTDLIRYPKSVHGQTDQHVLVAAENGLFRMTTGGQGVSQVIAGNFRDVHVNNDIIAALEWIYAGKDKVHILDNTDPPSGHRYITLDHDYSIRLLVTGEHVYVSFSKYRCISYISKYTVTGEKLCQYGEYGYGGPGHVDVPVLCGWDSQHSVLVADTNNHRLQVLDTTGGWRVIVPPGLDKDKCPLDVVITLEGHVYILYLISTSFYIQKFLFTEK